MWLIIEYIEYMAAWLIPLSINLSSFFSFRHMRKKCSLTEIWGIYNSGKKTALFMLETTGRSEVWGMRFYKIWNVISRRQQGSSDTSEVGHGGWEMVLVGSVAPSTKIYWWAASPECRFLLNKVQNKQAKLKTRTTKVTLDTRQKQRRLWEQLWHTQQHMNT